jgi:hypothetical protein
VEVNHLQFDYRNTCAIINFNHKACCADQEKAIEISQKIKNKIENIQSNPLEHLIKIQFGTKKNPLFPFEKLIDFPILSLEEMQDQIFFGSYYLRQSKSYFSDMHRTGTYCNITVSVLESYKTISQRDLDQGMNADKQRQQIQRYIFFAVLYKSLQKKLIVRSFLYYELNLNRCCCR